MAIIDEWAGELTIQKELKEIKELLIKLNNDVTKLKSAICDDDKLETPWDYWGDIIDDGEE